MDSKINTSSIEIERIVEIKKRLSNSTKLCGKTKIITIDGPSGSGKTTLAKFISNFLEGSYIIHMDELYNGWEQPLNEKLFNNIFNWIIKPISESEPITYFKFDWINYKRLEKRTIESYSNIIIEGVGSNNLKTRQFSNLKIWIEADANLTLSRVLNRDGYKIKKHMLVWREKEKLYFANNNVKINSDLYFKT